MIDRKTLKKGSVVWFGEMDCGEDYGSKVRVERATVRRAPPTARGGVWLDGCSRMVASDYQLFPTEAAALESLFSGALDAQETAASDLRAVRAALADFFRRRAAAEKEAL